jgi:hypothetical protein
MNTKPDAKLIAMLILVASCGAVSALCEPLSQAWALTQAQARGLVENALGSRPVAQQWTTPLPGGAFEAGAVYAAPGGDVQFDAFLGTHREHNGIACYLASGETLVSKSLRRLPTAGGTALFEVAVLRSEGSMRAVAATECSAQGCTEHALSGGLSLQTAFDRSRGLLMPASIMLSRAAGPGTEPAALTQELEQAASTIDLRPLQQLAASAQP